MTPDLERSPTARRRVLDRLEKFVRLTDEAFRVPVIDRPVGLDAIIGLIPGVGDVAGAALGAVIPITAWRMGAPWSLIGRMTLNLGLDLLVGTVPLLGDAFDLVFKANRRNLELLRRRWHELDAAERDEPPVPEERRRDRTGREMMEDEVLEA
jgi:hypothetical protein